MIKKRDDGGPAFPQNLPDDFVWRLPGNPGGMSLRDYFAGQALASLTSGYVEVNGTSIFMLARDCYSIADAMLNERAKT